MIDKFQGKTRWLSNFQQCAIVYGENGEVWPSTEHLFQALKTHDRGEREFIRNLPTPGQAKRAGRQVELRDTWEDIKIDVMFMVNMMKYNQNPQLKEMLLATGDEELIEGNEWGDTFWGVCNGVGRNELGKILMRIRIILRNGDNNLE